MLSKSDLQAIGKLITEANNALKKEVKDDILSFKDAILKEIQALREDMIIVSGYKD